MRKMSRKCGFAHSLSRDARRLAKALFWAVATVLATSAELPGEQPTETLPGFKADNLLEARGIDNISLYSGDPGIVIPLGPEYSLGPNNRFQLNAHYSAKLWKFDQSCHATIYPNSLGWKHAYVSGYPTLGAGWTLELGYVGSPSSLEGTGKLVYHSPDGGQHPESPTVDGSRLRITRYPSSGPVTHYTVESSDGTVQTFNQRYLRPQPTAGESFDFNDNDWDFLAGNEGFTQNPRFGLSSIRDAFGREVLTVQYEGVSGTADAWRVRQINLNPNTSEARSIVYNWRRKLVGSVEWWVLNTIAFPASGGQTLTVTFAYLGDTGNPAPSFPRNRYDNSLISDPLGRPGCPQAGAVFVPLLERISLGSFSPTISYSFTYNLPPSYSGTFEGTLASLTLPTSGRISYIYDRVVRGGGSCIDGSCPDLETTAPVPPAGAPAAAFTPGPDREPRADFMQRFYDSTAAVVSRTATDPLTGLTSATTYSRFQQIPLHNYAPYDPDEFKLTRQVIVTAPGGNGSVPRATKHLFHTTIDPDYNNSGIELARRYYSTNNADETNGALVVRSVVNCWGNAFVLCGYRNAAGTIHPWFDGSRPPHQAEVTWFGVHPAGGGVCSGTTPYCLSRSSSGYEPDTEQFETTVIGGTFPNAGTRTTFTDWTPQTGGIWLLDLWKKQQITESLGVVRRYAFWDNSNGFQKSQVTWDSTRQRILKECSYKDTLGNVQKSFSATEAASTEPLSNPCPVSMPSVGTDGDSFGRTNSHQTGLLLTSQWMNGTTPAWSSTNLQRNASTGLVTSSTDPAGFVTAYVYDTLGRLASIDPPGSEVATSVAYDSPTQTTVTRNAGTGLSTWQRYLYDGFGRVTREIRQMPSGSSSAYSVRRTAYDEAGNAFSVSEWTGCSSAATCASATPSFVTTVAGYDVFGRAGLTTRADGSRTSVSWQDGSVVSDWKKTLTVGNVDGTCASGACANGSDSNTIFDHDAFGRLVRVTEPGGALTSYGYDPNDKLSSVSQPGRPRTFTHDAFGFLRTEITPEGGTVSYTAIGSIGNVLSESRPGVVLNRTFDFAGQATALRSNEGGARDYLANQYDAFGRLSSRNAWSYGTTPATRVDDTYAYGGLGGRLSSRQTSVVGSASLTTTQRWEYNNLGLLAHHYHPRPTGGKPFVVSPGYENGQPVRLHVNGIPLVGSVRYHPSGNLAAYSTGASAGPLVTTTIAEDRLPRPAQISAGSFNTGSYVYDGAGNVKSMGADLFGYDLLSRLTSANLGGTVQNYGYDAFGNMWTKGPTTYCDAANPCANNRAYFGASYDGRGNLLNYSGTTYTWDALDRMSTQTAPTFWRYTYDGSNERVAKLDPTGAWAYTFRDEANRIASEFAGAIQSRDNVVLGNFLVASYANSAVAGNGPTWTFYSSDHLGSPRLVTNLAGGTVETRKYWPFGEDATAHGTLQRLRFASMERDAEGSRYYDHARSHDFAFGRFISPDVIGGDAEDPQAWNRYAYSRNNPLKFTDPDGKAFWFVAAVVVGAIAAVLTSNTANAPAHESPTYESEDVSGASYGAMILNAGKGAAAVYAVEAAISEEGPDAPRGPPSESPRRGGETEHTKNGRQAHKEFAEKVRAKEGWQSDPRIKGPDGKTLKPDAITPSGRPIELKPNTRSGRAQGARQLKRYEEALGKKGRVIYYDPKKIKKPPPV